MFNRNDNEGIARNVSIMAKAVDEIVIVDSSDPPVYGDLLRRLLKYGETVSVHRAIPLGYVEPLRMYGIKKVSSSHFLLLDADVRPSDELVNFLSGARELDDLIYVPYYDSTFNRYYDSPAVYRKDSVTFRGIIHEWPILPGDARVRKLHLPHRIEGSISLDMWSEKYMRYYFVEAVCRPFSYNYRRSVSKRLIFRMLRGRAGELPAIMSAGFIALVPIYVLYRDHSIRMARLEYRYNLNKYLYFRRLPKGIRSSIISISEDMYKNGGIIRYLNLDDTAYVEDLTEQFHWNMAGVELLYELLKYRYEKGKCVNDLGQLRASR